MLLQDEVCSEADRWWGGGRGGGSENENTQIWPLHSHLPSCVSVEKAAYTESKSPSFPSSNTLAGFA